MIPASTLDRLAASLDASARDELRFATAEVDVDALGLVRAGTDLFGRAFYFSTPEGEQFGGLGTAWQSSASGAGRFEATAAAIEALSLPAPFRAVVGFSFAPDGPRSRAWSSFAAVDAVVPQASLIPSGGGHLLAIVAPAGVDGDQVVAPLRSLTEAPPLSYPDLGGHTLESVPSVADWRTAVGEAVDAIGRASLRAKLDDSLRAQDDDDLRKVVLSRSVIVRSDSAPGGFDLVHHLEATYPRCFGFGWQAGSATFVGASPELLVRSIGGAVTSNPLAGSAPRGEGEEEDRALAEGLMRSPKDRIEHRLVVDDVVDRLAPYVAEVTVPDGPSLKRMATVQHLSTPVSGTLIAPTHVLELVDALHPTPAVGGTPRARAVSFIDKVEGFDRGWYTGGVGWVDGSGDGEFAIALRCGLIEGTEAHIFAGAGIVADSEPEAELLETRLKLRPLLELLAAT
jgi:salicylate biosynthesis isochorismate synthase